MTVAVSPAPPADLAKRNLRVMIVDDAVVVRGLFARWIDAEPDLDIAASLRTGREAVNQFERVNPDVVVLDIDMPELDGLAALPLLLQKKPGLVVIMASTLTRRNAEISLKALSLGAADYIPKPESAREVTASLSFRRELIDKIRQLGARGRCALAPPRTLAPPRFKVEAATCTAAPSIVPARNAAAQGPSTVRLRPFSTVAPRVLLIGSSTGGPQALTTLIPQLGPVLQRAPVLITQHMPATFTTILAEHLQRVSGRPVREAIDGEPAAPGTVYVAPGGRHLRVVRTPAGPALTLDDGPQVNFCKPAVDPMFASAAGVWGASTLGVVLTGMGSDGMNGVAAIAAAGGSSIAQDEDSSVIWGMPAQAVSTGLCSAVVPLSEMAARIARLFAGDRA